MEEAVVACGNQKRLVLVLNKIGAFLIMIIRSSLASSPRPVAICVNGQSFRTYLSTFFDADLVPTKNVELWLKHLRNEFPTVAFKASTQTQKQHLVRER